MEKLYYKMASRATILLGRESVSRVDGALIELIKNAYDADASICFLCFDIRNDQILIIDNGIGMTREIIEHCWMMIGTDNKRNEYYTSKHRIKSGEKGIGRFALDRLGSKCTMYTKNQSEKLIRWYTDWSNFEEPGKTLDEVEADFEYVDCNITDVIPESVFANINKIAESSSRKFDFDHGTVLVISSLRDNWSAAQINKTITALGFLIPPGEQTTFTIIAQDSIDSNCYELTNDIYDDFDYRIVAAFSGSKFTVKIDRNELDLGVIPNEIFSNPRFNEFPFRYEDMLKGTYTKELTIPELLHNSDPAYIETVKSIGNFLFTYSFMKGSVREDGRGVNYYKSIGKHRKLWIDEFSGIKIYRDNFVVRPYGDKTSNSFDWLRLDARKSTNPVAVSDKSEQWHVSNSQGQGTVLISRVMNEVILDKSSREGIIENEYFSALCDILREIIGLFEKDRAYIARTIRIYTEEKEGREKAKQEAKDIAVNILGKQEEGRQASAKDVKMDDSSETAGESVKLAKAVRYYEEEVEDLISEIRLLRALATNGLITTSIIHDLKSLNAMLVSRVETLKLAISSNNETLINRHLSDLSLNDEFLKSWITVITTQSNRDKRRRLKRDLSAVIRNCVNLLQPILARKKVEIELEIGDYVFERRIFEADFDSIIYNLIINSIESFEHAECPDRRIIIKTETANDDFIIRYQDNGAGLSDAFINDPYKIFEYGTTSKFDSSGNQLGTGLGMYIVSSSVKEYMGNCLLTKIKDGFGIDIFVPKGAAS